ncbi:MAG: HAMP domain-containing protein [Phycisphaeraceae bacterium]|nr:HAMP domain-containing protein [Phycisphaeraceae bacterium]
MAQKKLLWQLFPSYLLITVGSLIVVTGYVSLTMYRFNMTQTQDELTRLAQIVRQDLMDSNALGVTEQVNLMCQRVGLATEDRVRITVILPDGRVIGDSREEVANMGDHSDREEILAAMEAGLGYSIRQSPTLGIHMMYVAIPARQGGRNLAVVRTSIATTDIKVALQDMLKKIAFFGVAVAIGATLLSLVASRRISRPIVTMERIAREFSEGALEQRIPIWGTRELSSLGRTLNTMAHQLDVRIRATTGQRNELEAILTSMIEGVIAVDWEGHIVSLNRAAARLLHIDPEQAHGQPIETVVRDVGLRDFVQQTLQGGHPSEKELMLPIDGPRFFHVHGAQLADDQHPNRGAVIVLHDMTRIHHLERLRRDFVANVSHELKTPVTSIQGFLEAVSDMGFEDADKVKQYLAIVTRHAERLNAIIDDLLTLSRLEEDGHQRDIRFVESEVSEIVQSAIEMSSIKAQEKNMGLNAVASGPVMARVNAALVEQALVNLIENAVKYSDAGSSVDIAVRQNEAQVEIAVSDHGCGIATKHHAHLFERFYVVDKGRSRKMGGTGLGLAIVKHIANVHGGTIQLKSEFGKGSVFTLCLPRKGRSSA